MARYDIEARAERTVERDAVLSALLAELGLADDAVPITEPIRVVARPAPDDQPSSWLARP
ncbi:hypothetical protein P0W64_14750 [Tsukamurella sp. 8F]|uniref:hypothetical protein n=1 Tax=unclassified Tsukamurella TaxID=2633480 RepID=UPI0023B8C27B|nr:MULTISPECIES: hypothetical protein [unclassified Tsukamurella]MDF0531762.1 hypothetical protein [Tsukamurella sp. 8J]MDF0588036.1 hypothetical protein [Tsukamurella sp. 8F]